MCAMFRLSVAIVPISNSYQLVGKSFSILIFSSQPNIPLKIVSLGVVSLQLETDHTID
jgi:hypothetical protein